MRLVISVIAGVVIVILIMPEIDIVKNYAEHFATDAQDGLFYSEKHAPRETSVLHNDDGVISSAGDDGSIADAQYWRRIDEEQVVAKLKLRDEI